LPDVSVNFELILPEGDRARTLDVLEASGGRIHRSGEPFRPDSADPLGGPGYSAFEPFVVIAGAMGAVALLRRINSLWRDISSKGGGIVDARGGKLRLLRLPDVERGKVTIITDDGTSVHECTSDRAFSDVVERALNQ
jgi:hypothetical protein